MGYYSFQFNLFSNGAWRVPAVKLSAVVDEVPKFNVRISKCWIKSSTKPTPNSTAENIRKKNVSDSKFKLS